MMQNGYIKLHRSITKWELWDDQNAFRLFVTLLLMANVTDTDFHGYHIERGQVLTSIQRLSEISGLSNMQVRTALKKLEVTKTITNTSCPKNRVISIKNYDKYQSVTKQITKSDSNKDFNKVNNKCFNKAKKPENPCAEPITDKCGAKHNKVNNKANNKVNNNKIRRNNKGVSKDTPLKEKKEELPLPWANSAWKPVIPEGMTEEEYAALVRELSR